MFELQRRSAVELNLQQLIDCQGFAIQTPAWRRLASAEQAGNQLSRQRGRGMEFEEVRQYQAGDDIRSIDWRVTARTGTPHTKIYREERDRPVVIALDLSASSFFGSRDKLKAMMAAELSAILGWRAHKGGQRIGILIQRGAGRVWLRPQAQRSRWLANLQLVCEHYAEQINDTSRQPAPLTQSLDFLNHNCRSGYQLHLISDFYALSDVDAVHLTRLAHHNQLTAWQVTDPLEFELPSQATATPLKVAHSSGLGQLPLGDAAFRQRYALAAQTRQAFIERHLRSGLMTYHHISTASDWPDYV
jgi:uncharacterized protein (DUF58 family)